MDIEIAGGRASGLPILLKGRDGGIMERLCHDMDKAREYLRLSQAHDNAILARLQEKDNDENVKIEKQCKEQLDAFCAAIHAGREPPTEKTAEISQNHSSSSDVDTPDAAEEGEWVERKVRSVKRAVHLRAKKIAQFKRDDQDGILRCEICGVDGRKYHANCCDRAFEVHHLNPVGTSGKVETTLDDLAVLCANCHNAVHAKKDVEDNIPALQARILHPKD